MTYPLRTRFQIQFASAPDSGFSLRAQLDAFQLADLLDKHFPTATGYWTIYPTGERFYADI